MLLRPGRSLAVVCVAAASVAALGIAAASAEPAAPSAPATASKGATADYPLRVKTLSKSVLAPLQIAVGPHKKVYVADNARGTLFRIGDKKRIFRAPKGYEVAGVDVRANGDLAFTWGSPEKQ